MMHGIFRSLSGTVFSFKELEGTEKLGKVKKMSESRQASQKSLPASDATGCATLLTQF